MRWSLSLSLELLVSCASYALREEGREEKEKEKEGDERKKKTPQKTKPVIVSQPPPSLPHSLNFF